MAYSRVRLRLRAAQCEGQREQNRPDARPPVGIPAQQQAILQKWRDRGDGPQQADQHGGHGVDDQHAVCRQEGFQAFSHIFSI